MIDFELKIFANPSGFKELQLNNTQELFSQDLVLLRAYDAERDTFKEGAYSVFFTPACYIVSYQFDVPNEANFRGASAILAIAIRRGKKISDITSVFADLRGKVNRALVEVGSTSIYIKQNDFNETIQQNIQDDADQMFINCATPTNIKRALVGYNTLEELKHLLEVPNRQKFIGYNLVFFIPQAEAALIWNSIKNKYSAITFNDSEYEYQSMYEVVFPDGHTEIVSSRNSEINYTTKKPYYQNLNFNGKLSDKFNDWQVSQSEDKTRFIIGRKLEPDKQIFNVRLHDGDGSLLLSQNIVLRSNIGTYDGYNNELILTGEEIKNRFSVKLTPEAANRKIAYQKWERDEYIVGFAKMYYYDFTSILQTIKTHYGEEGVITLYSQLKNNFLATFTANSAIAELESPFEETYIIIEETKTTERTRKLYLQSDGSLKGKITLKKKEFFKDHTNYEMPTPNPSIKSETVKVIFKVGDPKIEKKAVNLTLKCAVGGKIESTFYKSDQAIIKNFSRKASNSVPYTVTIKGYKPIDGTIYFDSTDTTITIPLNFELTNKRKGARRAFFSAPFLILFFLFGFGSGWYVSPSRLIKDPDSELDKLDKRIADKDSIINELKDTLNKVINKYNSITQAINEEKENLESKLKGLKFTEKDIEEYKKMSGNNIGLVEDCKICLKIINANLKEKGKSLKKDILPYLQGNNRFKKLIIQEHKDIISFMIFNKGIYYNAYVNRKKDNYKSISEALEEFKKYNKQIN